MKPSNGQKLWMYETMCLIRHYEDSLAVAYFEGKLPPKIQKGLAFDLGAGLALVYGLMPLAWVLQAMLVVAFSALLFGKFCLGAYVYHLLKGRVAYANSTLPWA